MAGTPPYAPFQVNAYRLTQADAVGHPVPGTKKGYFSKQVVTVQIGVDKETGDEQTLKRGDGEICATSKDRDIIKRATLSMELCVLDAAAIAFLTGSILYADAGVPLGYQVLGPSDDAPDGVIWEGWSKAWDNNKQAAADAVDNEATYFHVVLPLLTASLGNLTLDTKHNAIPITGECAGSDFATINGPYDDWPDYVAAAGGVTRPYGVFLDTLPTQDEGYLNVTALAS
jgi:hypothetical protein